MIGIVDELVSSDGEVRPDSRLTELGIGSLLAVRLGLAIERELGVELEVSTFAEPIELEELAHRIEERRGDEPVAAPAAASEARTVDPGERVPLTDLQQAYLVGREAGLTDDPVGCTLYREFELERVDVPRLETAWRQVVERHPALRMVVVTGGRQEVASSAPRVSFVVHALEDSSASEREAAVSSTRERMRRRVFDAAGGGSMFSVEVSHRSSTMSTVHLAIDGLLTDGHGLSILVSDWAALYDQPEVRLEAPRGDYRGHLLALSSQGAERRKRQLAEWIEHFEEGVPPSPALGGPAADLESGPRLHLHESIPVARTRGLWAVAERWGVSPSSLVLACFMEVLARSSEPQRAATVVVTQSVRDRCEPAPDGVIGPFTNTLLVDLPDPNTASWPKFARGVHRRLWDAVGRGAVGGTAVLRELRRRHGQAPPSLPVVYTSMLGISRPGGRLDRFTASEVLAASQTSGVQLDFQVEERDGSLHLRWDVLEAAFTPGGAQVSFAALVNSLEALATLRSGPFARWPLNALQQAYYVTRASPEPVARAGCQVYLSFEVDELDLPRLEKAWHRVVMNHDVMRATVTREGELVRLPVAPARLKIPVIDLEGRDDAAACLEELAHEMAGVAFPLGRWPMADLRVTLASGTAVVHLALDLILLDGISLHRLARELMHAYADPRHMPRRALPWPPIERSRSTDDVAAVRAYWRDRFAEMPAGPAVPDSEVPAHERRRFRLVGEVGSWRAVADAAAADGLEPDHVVLAALLEAFARQWGDAPFSLPVVRWSEALDPHRPAERTVLSWVSHDGARNSVLDRARRVRELLAADPPASAPSGLDVLRTKVLRARRSGEFSLPLVYTSVLQLEGDLLPEGVRHGPWLTYTPDVAIDCIAMDEGGGLRCTWDADEAVVVRERIQAVFDTFLELLGAAVDGVRSPSAPVEPPTLPEPLRTTVLQEWNDTAAPFHTDDLIHGGFERYAAARPGAIALRWSAGQLSFGELNALANRIAWRLRRSGVAPGDLVAVHVPRGPLLIAAVLGVVKAGGAYVPLDRGLPAPRIHSILRRSQCRRMLMTEAADLELDPAVERIVLDDTGPAEGGPWPSNDLEPIASTDDVAYVIFTSGSTGEPKGVVVTHRPVLNLLRWAQRRFDFDDRDIGLAIASIGFDLSVFDVFGVLGEGGSLYVANEREQKDPDALLQVLLEQRITFWNSAPAALAQVMPLVARAQGQSETEHLRLVFLSGDFTPLSLPDELRAVFGGAKCINLGGATEATVWSNYHEIGAVDPEWRSIPYGRPIDNARYYILDESLEPVAPGVEGDLYIGGDCLAAGYLREPELTARSFVLDPFVANAGSRMYRTGDRALFLPDGVMSFVGRNDGQVKIRGFRVELGEIEHCLRQHPGIKDAVVLARTDAGGDRKLVAYLRTESEAAPSTRELRAHAAATLPSYMVPNFCHRVESWPVTANGKLDRDALPWPLNSATTELAAPVAELIPEPKVPAIDQRQLCREVASMFADALGVDVDEQEDLWDQGATSFTMVQVSNRLRDRFGCRIPVAALIDDATVVGVAALVAERMDPSKAGVASAVVAESPTNVRPSPPIDEEPASVDLLDANAVARFKARHLHRRPRSGATTIALPERGSDRSLHRLRATCRRFESRVVAFESLAQLLGSLADVPGEPTRRLYPSAGETYAVQVYVHVRDGAVESVPGGLYHYRPSDNELERIEGRLGSHLHFIYNRPIAEAAAFGLFLVGQTRAIEPLYGDLTDRLLAVEAGYMGQLLMMGQASAGLGLCPIGDVATEVLTRGFGLDPDHRFVHALLGGPVDHDSRHGTLGFPRSATSAEAPRSLPDEVAVVGMAVRCAGADTPSQLWSGLASGSCSIRPLPPARRAQLAAGGHALPEVEGGFLDSIDHFDCLRFRVSPREAKSLDPQIRLLLQAVWSCLEEAGHTAESLRRDAPRVGVFVAAMWHDYQLAGADARRNGGDGTVSALGSDIANRVSFAFGFDGPSLAIDTSCTSSITALHLASRAIASGECDAAIVAAVNLVSHPFHLGILSDLELLGEGAVRAFDTNATGWNPGEGAAAVLLRPHGAALGGGEHVHGIVEATRVGHSGRGRRLTAARSDVLARSLEQTLRDAGRSVEELDYVECSAAGASIADQAELEAIEELVRGQRTRALPIGTTKPNVGHLEAAAGLVQLIKVLLQLKEESFAPTLAAADALAGQIDAVDLVTEPRPWRTVAGSTRRALVNAMGATGTHGHALIREAELANAVSDSAMGPNIITLSATTPEALSKMADALRRSLEAAPDGGRTLPDVAFTTQCGRAALPHRAAFVADDRSRLVRSLDAFVSGRFGAEVLTGHVPTPDTGSPRSVPADPYRAARAWCEGVALDWRQAWRGSPRRVSLPGHPAAEESYWLDPSPRATEKSPASERAADTEALEQHLVRVFARVSGFDVAQVSVDVPFEEYGIDSRMIVELSDVIGRELSSVPNSLFFEARDLAEVADYLRARGGTTASSSAKPSPARGDATGTDEPIAIIGLAGRYPGAADLDALWELLVEGRDMVGPLPSSRRQPGWPVDSMWGAFLEHVDRFDPLTFGISPRDAGLMDPQERLFLEVAWEGLEDAGYGRTRLRTRHGSRCGVFVGAMYNEYPFFGVERTARGGEPLSCGSAIAGIANRVSHFLDANGPSLTVDTMCSSSLTALHLAVESLRRGECEVGLVGGINLCLHPNKFVTLNQLGMASSDHRCRSFGTGGDGFVPGEGIGAVILKPLSRARADGDRIRAVVRATAINHGGHTHGYTVPNPRAQASVITEALRRAEVNPRTIDYIEAHGTGTSLGDPVEIAGLTRAFGSQARPVPHAVGSIKSNLGHLEAAAGVLGLTKCVLQLEREMLVPSLHADELNPDVDWSSVPLRVQREAESWAAPRDGRGAGEPRRAAVSAFGAGGSNAHAIIEAGELRRRSSDWRSVEHGPEAIVLSARSEAQLRTVAGRLADHLTSDSKSSAGAGPAAGPGRLLAMLEDFVGQNERATAGEAAAHLRDALVDPSRANEGQRLADLAYTLQVGREPLRERFALVTDEVRTLVAQLRRFAAGEPCDAMRGRALPGGARAGGGNGVGTELSTTEARARAWVQGYSVDWEATWSERAPRLITLPRYPFDGVRCWLPDSVPSAATTTTATRRADTAVDLQRVEWVDAPHRGSSAEPTVLLCTHHAGNRDLAAALTETFGPGPVAVVGPPSEFERLRDDVAAALSRSETGSVVWVDLSDLESREAHDESWRERLALLQGLLRNLAHRGRELRLLHVTRGLLDAPGVEPNPLGARMAAFVRGLLAEDSAATLCTIDVDIAGESLVAGLRREAATGDAEGRVALRGGRRLVPAWRSLSRQAELGAPLDPRGLYLVTGGTRGIGAAVSRRLVHRGARHLLLLCRQPLPPREQWQDQRIAASVRESIETVAALESAGAEVRIHGESLPSRGGLQRVLDEARLREQKIAGVVHCAGVGPRWGRRFVSADLSEADDVLDPKVDGLEQLLELTAGDDLDFFIAFSSVSGSAPSLARGAADYAAANAFMDLRCSVEARRGRPICSIVWPAWKGSSATSQQLRACRDAGFDGVTFEQGLAVLDTVIASPMRAPVVLPRCTPDQDTVAVEEPAPPKSPATMPSSSLGWLRELFAKRLMIPTEELDDDVDFADLGVESMLLAELLEAMEERLGRPLEPGAILSHPTLKQLADHVDRVHPASGDDRTVEAGAAQSSPMVRTASADDGAIAVIGLSCRLPDAPDPDAFWQNLIRGRSSIIEVPPSRWSIEDLYDPAGGPGRSASKWGAFLDAIERFDSEAFGMSERDARHCDPIARLLLELSVEALSDAGYRGAELAGRDVGVFVGGRASRYRERVVRHLGVGGPGADQNFLAARIAHHLDLRGPNFVVDCACASGLVAAHLACGALTQGDCEVALVGAADVLLDEEVYREFTRAGALSRSGLCRTFDARADGFVPGEGGGLVVLKPLSRAIADGDRVQAVIEGGAVGNDGRTMGLTTPNPEAQAAVIRRAQRDAGISPDEVSMIEAHGTATKIGDPIELRALNEVFRESTSRKGFCAIGSVKSNIGHLLSAAGMAGLLKVVLAVAHDRIPATMHCEQPNPRFDFADSPFALADVAKSWPAGRRIAGVSAFGLGGTNAHLVVAQASEQGANVRSPLPPPALRRRHLWLTPQGRIADAPGSPPTSTPVEPNAEAPLVASTLRLSLT
ncbi:MAG: amino acid adenylation domain-containing protein [Myxococcota bacterium]